MNKNLMIGLGVLAVAGIGLYMWKRRKDEDSLKDKKSPEGKEKSSSEETKSNARGRFYFNKGTYIPKSKEDIALRDGKIATVILPPSGSNQPQPTNLWISSSEGGQDKCTWYDSNGNATVVYNRPCTITQANMKGGGSPN